MGDVHLHLPPFIEVRQPHGESDHTRGWDEPTQSSSFWSGDFLY